MICSIAETSGSGTPGVFIEIFEFVIGLGVKMEPRMGVEPTLEVYKTTVLPLNYQGKKIMVGPSGIEPDPGTNLVRFGL